MSLRMPVTIIDTVSKTIAYNGVWRSRNNNGLVRLEAPKAGVICNGARETDMTVSGMKFGRDRIFNVKIAYIGLV